VRIGVVVNSLYCKRLLKRASDEIKISEELKHFYIKTGGQQWCCFRLKPFIYGHFHCNQEAPTNPYIYTEKEEKAAYCAFSGPRWARIRKKFVTLQPL